MHFTRRSPCPRRVNVLATLGAEIKIGSPQDLDKMLSAERARWTPVVKTANIKME